MRLSDATFPFRNTLGLGKAPVWDMGRYIFKNQGIKTKLIWKT